MNLIKFRRQYLITSKTIKELSSWQKSMFNGMNVYAEQSLQMLKTSTKNNEFLLLGYWIDTHAPMKKNQDILEDIMKECKDFPMVLDYLYSLSGRFALFCRFGENVYGVSDAGGFRPIFYSFQNEEVNLTSNIYLLKYVFDLKEKQEKYLFEHSDFYKWSPTFGWCPGYTFFQNVNSVIANHYLDIKNKKTYRFFPCKDLHEVKSNEDIDKKIDKIIEILKNSIFSITSRENVSFSLTAGYDSRVILSIAKEYADQMYFWISYYSEKHADYYLPKKLLSDFGLKRHPIKYSRKKYRKYRKFYFENTPMAHNMWCKNHCSMIDNYPDNYTIIRGAASEVLKCEQFQTGEHPKDVNIDFVSKLPNFYYLNYSGDEVKSIMKDYLKNMQDLCIRYGYKTLDFLQWEAGNSCGQWQAQSQLESDFICDVFVPLSNREVWDLFLSIPYEYRIRKNNFEVYQRIINKTWPEMLNYPFNPPHKYSKLEIKTRYYIEAIKFKLKKMFNK